MEFYVDVEDTYLTHIFNHYIDYFEYIKERFKVKLIKAMNNKGLFIEHRKYKTENIIDNFYNAKNIYETDYQTFTPELLVKQYKIKQKLKRLQGDF